MARKIICPHCKAETYNTPSCGRCGGPILRSQGEDQLTKEENEKKKIEAELVHKFGMFQRAKQVHSTLPKLVLARFKAVQKTDGVDLAGTKIVVERDRRQFVYTSVENQPAKFGPGKYSLGKIMLAGGGKKSEEYGCLICEVSETPFTVTFVFPDSESFKDNLTTSSEPGLVLQGIEEALNSLSLRTSDDRLGGALLQLRLCCTDPINLVRCHDATLTDDSGSRMEHTQSRVRRFQEPDKSMWKRALDWIQGNQLKTPKLVVKETFVTKQITMADLYQMIRYELAEAIGNSVRNFTVKELYDKQDSNRDRLHESIKKYMEKTLEGYGLQIVDVVAFQFRSPAYEEFLQRRGDIALQKMELENDRGATDIRRDKREMDQEEFEHAENLEEKKDNLSLERNARLQEKMDEVTSKEAKRADQLTFEKQKRRIELDNERIEFDRKQRSADEELEDKRQHKKALQALEYQAMLQDQQAKVLLAMQKAEHDRRLEAIKTIAGFPPEQQFLLAMQYNPQLQEAFVAMQHAQARQDKLAMAQQFQDQVQAIYGQQSEQTNALLLEAAKQLGLVASARAGGREAPPPQHVVIEQLPPSGG